MERWGGPAELATLPEPVPADGEVVIRLQACGVGLTVLNCMRGDLGDDRADLPRVPGHEIVGTIEEVGPGVARDRIGESVAVYFYLFCGRCPRCLEGRESLCDALAGYVGVNRDGGYAPLVAIPSRNAIALPPGLDPVLATTIPDAISTPVHVAGRAGIEPGQRVAVIAAGGGVGIHMVQVARAYGADVAGLDVESRKLAHLRGELGIEAVESRDFARARLPAGWGGRADVIVDLLGTPDSLRWALSSLAAGGRLVVLTTFRDLEGRLSPRELVLRQISVLGSRYASRSEVQRAAALVADGVVKPVVSRLTGIDDVDSIHDELRAGTLLGRGALLWE